MIGGVFSLASLAIMLIYDASLALFAVGYAVVAGMLLVLARPRAACGSSASSTIARAS